MQAAYVMRHTSPVSHESVKWQLVRHANVVIEGTCTSVGMAPVDCLVTLKLLDSAFKLTAQAGHPLGHTHFVRVAAIQSRVLQWRSQMHGAKSTDIE